MPNPSFTPEEADPEDAGSDGGTSSAEQAQNYTSRTKRRFAWLALGGAAAAGVALFFVVTAPPRNHPPKLSDFTPPYTCPTSLAPRSCSAPIKVAVECIDRRNLHPSSVSRSLTKTEAFNEKNACELLPIWLDKDPRILIVDRGKEDLTLTYRLSPSERKFVGIQVFVAKTNFLIIKPFNDQFDKASYFVEESLLELGKRGYLP